MNLYFSDDLVQRGLIAWMMVLMTFYGNNAIYVDSSLSAMRMSVGSYVVARLTLGARKNPPTTLMDKLTIQQPLLNSSIP